LKSFEASENLYDTIVGHSSGKRALEISCAGGHNLCLYGPPGSGKSLLAKSMQELLPPLSESEVLEVNKIYSAVGKLTSTNPLVKQRPYRDPHHTISYSGMVGGGSTPVPGEITLAHRGVLFMDEFAEFQRPVLEALRQPMEDGKITLVRSKGTFTYPAKFTLVAATNLCPCGNLGNPVVLCKCSPSEVARYKRKISGALLDRFDLFVYVLPVGKNELVSKPVAKFASNLQDVRRRILLAHEKQSLRLAPFGLIKNNEMQLSHINKLINLQDKDKEFLNFAAEKLNLSTRGYLKILKVARTIADLNNHEEINKDDLSESLQFRNKQLI
jgi:magnesium chelatase family protein